MSFVTEYFDEYREHPIRKISACDPSSRLPDMDGPWLDQHKGDMPDVQEDSDNAETLAFIKKAMKSLRGTSTYYNSYCAHLDPAFKTRPFVPRKKKPCRPKAEPGAEAKEGEEDKVAEQPVKHLDCKDTELMKVAKKLYERDMNAPTLKPLLTSFRILGYVRPSLYKTGLSEYQDSFARCAYELVRDDKIPKFVKHNGGRKVWGIPPEGVRQPELDAAPFDGERMY